MESTKHYEILPALLEQDFESIRQKALPFAGIAPIIQIDICDGVYTDQASWPFTQNPKPSMVEWEQIDILRQAGILVEFDLMIQNPEQYLVAILSANPRRVVVHLQSTDQIAFVLATLHGYQMEYPKFQYGIAFARDISDADVKKYIRQCDFVQIMGISEIGKQGQSFDESVLEQIQAIHEQYPENVLQIDGAVSVNVIQQLKSSGVERFAVGSGIFTAEVPVEEYYTLQKIINE
jgi:pentose-5-phosphate-3-epimerase